MKRVNYRRIWSRANGPIPREPNGRTYQIHHKDGNRHNNSLDNLQCVTVNEHYDIHFAQGDWAACHYLTARHISKTPEEISELQNKLVRAGTHPLQGKNNPVHQRVADGTHNFLGGELQRYHARKQVSEGTHHWLGSGAQQRQWNNQRVAQGTHTSLGPANSILAKSRGHHSTQQLRTCPHCGITCGPLNYGRWHGDQCRKGGKDYQPRTNTNYMKQMAEGRHPSQIKYTCPHCGIRANSGNYKTYHGDHCRHSGVSYAPRINLYNQRLLSRGQQLFPIKLTCPHCNKSYDQGNYTHWHGNQCRFRKEP
jgi:hypothetical protein